MIIDKLEFILNDDSRKINFHEFSNLLFELKKYIGNIILCENFIDDKEKAIYFDATHETLIIISHLIKHVEDNYYA